MKLMEHPLPEVEVLKRCPASWRQMKGNDQVRFCSICRKNVYNLSNMTAEQAFQVMEDTEGNFCARFYQRPDGSVVTTDCSKFEHVKIWSKNSVASALGALSLSGLAMMFWPIMGQSKSAGLETSVRAASKEVNLLEHEIAVCKDPAKREELVVKREKAQKELKMIAERAIEN